jgi:hypothetical protein
MKSKFRQFVSVLLLCTALTGCTVLSYTAPNGERLTRYALGANTSISSLRLDAGTNGERRVELQGYSNDSSQALATVTAAAVKAAVSSAK